MSLKKAITHKKEKRKEYRGSESHDKTCRPHGGCPWCEGNRMHAVRLQELKMNVKDFDLLAEDSDHEVMTSNLELDHEIKHDD